MIVPAGEDAKPRRLFLVLAGQRRHERDAHLLAGLEAGLGEDVAGRFDHAPGGPGVGAGALQDLAQGIAGPDAEHLRLAPLEVGERVLFLLGRLDEDSGVGRRGAFRSLGAERHAVGTRNAVALGLGAGADPLRLDLGLLGLGNVLQNLGILELLPVLVGQDAAQQLDDVDG